MTRSYVVLLERRMIAEVVIDSEEWPDDETLESWAAGLDLDMEWEDCGVQVLRMYPEGDDE